MYRPFKAPTGIAVPVSAVFLTGFLYSPLASGAESGRIEEVIVTAQRTEESVQDVPIAVTALTGQMLEDRGIINPSDLQLNTPNVTFTASNFGGSNLAIRGIGNFVISGGGEGGVSTNVNEIPVNTNLTAIEFYDVDRVEVLRGPQGTLFGKNSTGGAVNLVTKMPTMDSMGGFIDGEYGDYDNRRVKGAFNLPLNDSVALRFAGYKLERDGYTDNTAGGQVGLDGRTLPGIDDNVDGRDLFSYRITGKWDMSDRADLWVMYSKFREKDDKTRLTNQVCQRTALPFGCTADGFGFDSPHLSSTTGGLFAGMSTLPGFETQGAVPLGASGGPDDTSVTYNWPAPVSNDLRKMHTDFEPKFKNIENLFAGGFNYDFDKYQVGLRGAYQENKYVSQMDYNMDVNVQTTPTPILNPQGIYPTSAPNGDYSAGFSPNDRCNWEEGTAGIFGGAPCTYPGPTDRIFAYDHASSSYTYWTVEGKVASDYDGRFNFVAGANTYETSGNGGDYYVISNSLDIPGYQGAPLLGLPRSYPTMFDTAAEPNFGTTAEGYAFFGEVYFDLTPSLKLTGGLRYNKDKKYTSNTGLLYNSFALQDFSPFFLPDTAPPAGLENPYWTREALYVAGYPIYDADRAALYGATDLFEAGLATEPFSPERFAASEAIGIITGFNETRSLSNSPDSADWDEWTGRAGVDWSINDNSMAYAFYSRGYKPGGFNPPVNPAFAAEASYTYESERVDAFEIGTKNTFLDGSLVVNGSVFYYQYKDLQVTRIRFNSSINENIDSDNWGIELETVWNPDFAPALQIDAAYSYLSTDLQNVKSVDLTNRTAGNPDYVQLKNIDLGSATGTNYIAPVADVLAATPQALADVKALSVQNGTALAGTDYPNGIPAFFSRSFLDEFCTAQNGSACTSEGIDADLDGNKLPNSPENTLHIGAQYTFNVSMLAGTITPRVDYYWQDDMYGREFNTKGDEIDSWDQWNASLIYESNNGSWKVTVWGRNLEDEDNVTGHYLTSDTSGLYRNYFLTEPRVWGASVRYAFGGG